MLLDKLDLKKFKLIFIQTVADAAFADDSGFVGANNNSLGSTAAEDDALASSMVQHVREKGRIKQ